MLANLLRGAVLFALLGPSVASITAAMLLMALSNDWFWPPLFTLDPGNYLTGAAPAITCGVLAGLVRSRLRGLGGYLLIGSVAALVSCAYYFLALGHSYKLDLMLLLAASGFVAGLLCGIAFIRLPNYSFKPKLLRGST